MAQILCTNSSNQRGWRDENNTVNHYKLRKDGTSVGWRLGLDAGTYLFKDGTKVGWRHKTFEVTITWDPNGGTVNPTSQKILYGSAIGTLPTPTRSGYTFVGWFTVAARSGGTQIISTSIMTSDITYYARWNRPPNAPVVTITPTPVDNFINPSSAGAISITATCTDPDGDTVTLTATRAVGSGTATAINLGQNYSYATGGPHVIVVTATDSFGATNSTAKVFYVADPNQSSSAQVSFSGLTATATPPAIAGFRVKSWKFFALVSEGHSSGNSDRWRVEYKTTTGSWVTFIDQIANYSAYAAGNNVNGTYSGYKDFRNASTSGNTATGGTAISGSFTPITNAAQIRMTYIVASGHEGCITSGTSRLGYSIDYEYIT